MVSPSSYNNAKPKRAGRQYIMMNNYYKGIFVLLLVLVVVSLYNGPSSTSSLLFFNNNNCGESISGSDDDLLENNNIEEETFNMKKKNKKNNNNKILQSYETTTTKEEQETTTTEGQQVEETNNNNNNIYYCMLQNHNVPKESQHWFGTIGHFPHTLEWYALCWAWLQEKLSSEYAYYDYKNSDEAMKAQGGYIFDTSVKKKLQTKYWNRAFLDDTMDWPIEVIKQHSTIPLDYNKVGNLYYEDGWFQKSEHCDSFRKRMWKQLNVKLPEEEEEDNKNSSEEGENDNQEESKSERRNRRHRHHTHHRGRRLLQGQNNNNRRILKATPSSSGATKSHSWKIGILNRKEDRAITNADTIEQNLQQSYPSAIIDVRTFDSEYELKHQNDTLAVQAQWFATQDLILLAHGAAMTNVIFMRPKTSAIVELYPQYYFNDMFWPLQQQCGIQHQWYYYHNENDDGKKVNKKKKKKHHSSDDDKNNDNENSSSFDPNSEEEVRAATEANWDNRMQNKKKDITLDWELLHPKIEALLQKLLRQQKQE